MDTYLFHQTPEQLAIDLIKEVPFEDNDIVLEPFRGEGAFYNNFPDNVMSEWCEITQGRDYTSYDGNIDWVVSNPPFRLDKDGKRENAFWVLLNYYTTRVNKGIAFLGNDYCLATLTPRRIKLLNDNGLYLHNIIVCSVKKWRGRYFFMIFKKEKCNTLKYLSTNY